MACRRVRNKACNYRGLPHLPLLETFPAIRMRQYKLDPVLNGVPKSLPINSVLGDIAAGACKEVVEEVGEDIDDGFSRWEWG